jgi:hypothetical protein
MPVLAAMGEREAGRIAEAAGRAVHDLGHHRERPDGAGADPRHQQQVGEIPRPAIRCRGERSVQPALDHVLGRTS